MAFKSSQLSISPARPGFNPSDPKSNMKSVDPDKNGNYVPNCTDRSYERERMLAYWDELNRNTGVRVSYFSHGYSLDKHDFLYGEDPTSSYRGPRTMKAMVTINTAMNILNKYGIMSENDVEILIPIKEWQRTWGAKVFPKMGDLVRIIDSACTRPEGQDPWVFEITDQYDRANAVDFLGGHYVWKMSAKRFDYSFEPDAPRENKTNDDISDTAFPPDSPRQKSYEDNVDDEAQKDFKNPNSGVYGNYL